MVFLQLSSTTNPVGRFAFQTNSSVQEASGQLDYLIAKIPANASLATESIIIAHVPTREYVEDIEMTRGMYFTPDYILLDFNRSLAQNWYNTWQADNFYSYERYATLYNNATYVAYAYDGTAVLFKKV